MADSDKDDRTEAATARRVQRARDEGQVAVSTELSPLLSLGAMAAALLLNGPAVLARLGHDLAALLSLAGRLDGPSGIAAALRAAGGATLRALAGVFAVTLVAGAAAALLQTGFLFNTAALMPDLSRLNPQRGLRRVFGAANRIHAATAAVKLAVMGAALWRLLGRRAGMLADAIQLAPASLPGRLLDLAASVVLTVLAAQAVVAVIDLVLVHARHARSLRMTRGEIKEEARESNGAPEIKARIRRLRAQRARYRMAQAVAKATVVVTNPTHYAVALTYDRTRSAAPRVVAKGMDEMAARIRELAAEHDVPLIANPPLARALHRVELDADIPQELYQAVAELIAYVWRLQARARRPA